MFDGPSSARTVRVPGGALVLASYRVQRTWVAKNTIIWFGQPAAVWGTQPRAVLRETDIASATFFVPDAGPARPLGYLQDHALF